MNKEIIIYGLFDPRTGDCFYIGKTERSIVERLKEHISNDASKNYHKKSKIQQILSCGLKPVIGELLRIEDYNIPELQTNFNELVERYFISYCKEVLEEPITNIAEGGNGGSIGKCVKQYDLNGNFIKQYKSCTDAAKDLGLDKTIISKCCKKVKYSKSAGGFQWCFEGDEETIKKYSIYDSLKKTVMQYDLDNKYLNTYESINDAARKTGISDTNITFCCKGDYNTAGGYKWKYKFN